MKKLSAVAAVFIAASLMYALSAQASATGPRTVTGEIINITGDYMEVKWGRHEVTIHFTASATYQARDGSAAALSVLELCQKVRARYERHEGRNVLVSVRVIREGYCTRP